MTLGQRLRRLREDRGLTQSDLARLAEVTPAGVWQIENDKRAPNSSTLEKLARALQISIDALMGHQTDDSLLSGDDGARVLLRGYQELTQGDQDAVREMVEALRRKKERRER